MMNRYSRYWQLELMFGLAAALAAMAPIVAAEPVSAPQKAQKRRSFVASVYEAEDLVSTEQAFTEHFSSSAEQTSGEGEAGPAEPAISLQDAVVQSLQHNPAVAVSRLSPAFTREDVRAALGAFDTTFRQSNSFIKAKEASESVFTDVPVSLETFDFDFSLTQKIDTGADLSLTWHNRRAESNSPVTRLSPLWRTGVTFDVSQPLLKGTGWGTPEVTVRINEKLHGASLYSFQAVLAQHVKTLIHTYWSEVRARETVDVRKRSLALAKRLKMDIEQGVKAGSLPPLSLSEANAQVALRREELITARNDRLNAGRRLRQVLGADFDTELAGGAGFRPVSASQKPEFSNISFNQSETVQLALRQRPELRAQLLRIRAADLSARLAENSLLPDLRIGGSVGTSGLAGTDQGGLDYGEPLPPNPYPGSYDDALDLMDSGDYYDYRVGLSIEIPFQNRRAKAQATQGKLALLREQYQLRALRQSIVEEVLRALADLEASKKRVNAARQAVYYSIESVDAAQNKLRAGLSTVREVLEVQKDLAEAELKMAEALTDHLDSKAEVFRSRGDLLGQYGIVFENDAPG